jgi:hypothetical protein
MKTSFNISQSGQWAVGLIFFALFSLYQSGAQAAASSKRMAIGPEPGLPGYLAPLAPVAEPMFGSPSYQLPAPIRLATGWQVSFYNRANDQVQTVLVRNNGQGGFSFNGNFALAQVPNELFFKVGFTAWQATMLKRLSPLEGGVNSLRVGDKALISVGPIQFSGKHGALSHYMALIHYFEPELFDHYFGKRGFLMHYSTEQFGLAQPTLSHGRNSFGAQQLSGNEAVFAFVAQTPELWVPFLEAFSDPALWEYQLMVIKEGYVDKAAKVSLDVPIGYTKQKLKIFDVWKGEKVWGVVVFGVILKGPGGFQKTLDSTVNDLVAQYKVQTVADFVAIPEHRIWAGMGKYSLRKRVNDVLNRLEQWPGQPDGPDHKTPNVPKVPPSYEMLDRPVEAIYQLGIYKTRNEADRRVNELALDGIVEAYIRVINYQYCVLYRCYTRSPRKLEQDLREYHQSPEVRLIQY